jgi:hypothetical protein
MSRWVFDKYEDLEVRQTTMKRMPDRRFLASVNWCTLNIWHKQKGANRFAPSPLSH